jgi:uncharacterized phage-like protein YoqJ
LAAVLLRQPLFCNKKYFREERETVESCAFSGHRAIPPSSGAAIRDLLARAIRYAYEQGCRTFYTGGAIGFDTYAAKAVILFRVSHPDVRLVLMLPCANQTAKWTPMQRAAYNYVLSEADESIVLSEEYERGCMERRNRALIDRADMLICYVCRQNGGSAQTKRFAAQKGIPIYNLYGAV